MVKKESRERQESPSLAHGTNIHPTAIVSPKARIGEGVKIGPYCIVGDNVTLGDNVYLHAHVVIDHVICDIGAGTEVFPFVSINKPQDLKFQGEASQVIIGKNTIIREYATIQPGTAGDRMKTIVGDHCLLMACTHVAHDCILGNYVQMANHATLAGHVTVGDYAIIGGLAAVHQFVTIGPHAIIGGMSGVTADVIPYGNVRGERACLNGLNLVGLKRRGFSREQIALLQDAYKMMFEGKNTLAERIQHVKTHYGQEEIIKNLIAFVEREEMRALLSPTSGKL
jgi:acyl-[acyl-carrier-protein]--UDP-N-acetylglucosamine O-acyltransferase (EC 2.3.1.129)